MLKDTKSTMVRFHQYVHQPSEIIRAMRFHEWRVAKMREEGLIDDKTPISDINEIYKKSGYCA